MPRANEPIDLMVAAFALTAPELWGAGSMLRDRDKAKLLKAALKRQRRADKRARLREKAEASAQALG